MRVPGRVLRRVFFIRRGRQMGTAFAVDRADGDGVLRQYIVTALHVLEGASDGENLRVRLFQNGAWRPVLMFVVGVESRHDVAVLTALPQEEGLRAGEATPLAPEGEALPSAAGHLDPGEWVGFLGFPFGWVGGDAEANDGYPLPFVKSGVLSAWNAPLPFENGATSAHFIDGQSNLGFSGGPLIHLPGAEGQWELLGVVVGSPNAPTPPSADAADPTGFVLATPAEHVEEIIARIPMGYPLGLRRD